MGLYDEWAEIKAETKPKSFADIPTAVRLRYVEAQRLFDIPLYVCGSFANGGYVLPSETNSRVWLKRVEATGKTGCSDLDICSHKMTEPIKDALKTLGFDVIDFEASRHKNIIKIGHE